MNTSSQTALLAFTSIHAPQMDVREVCRQAEFPQESPERIHHIRESIRIAFHWLSMYPDNAMGGIDTGTESEFDSEFLKYLINADTPTAFFQTCYDLCVLSTKSPAVVASTLMVSIFRLGGTPTHHINGNDGFTAGALSLVLDHIGLNIFAQDGVYYIGRGRMAPTPLDDATISFIMNVAPDLMTHSIELSRGRFIQVLEDLIGTSPSEQADVRVSYYKARRDAEAQAMRHEAEQAKSDD